MNVHVYMCVNIGFNESFDDGKEKSCVFVKEFNTKILNVVSVYIGPADHVILLMIY